MPQGRRPLWTTIAPLSLEEVSGDDLIDSTTSRMPCSLCHLPITSSEVENELAIITNIDVELVNVEAQLGNNR